MQENFVDMVKIAMCLATQLCLTFYNPMDCNPHQALCPWGFSRQEYWSGLPCPPPGDLPNPRIEPRSPALHMDSFTILSHQRSPGKKYMGTNEEIEQYVNLCVCRIQIRKT